MLLIAAYLLAGAVPLAAGLVRPGITGYERSQLEDMVYGQAYRPFVKRQFVPLIVCSGMMVIPASIKDALQNTFTDSRVANYLRWPSAYASEYVLTLMIMYASMLGFMLLLQRFLASCLTLPQGITHGVALAVALILPVCYAGQVYIYDFTQLMLFTGALLYMMKGRWAVFYPILALACLNKETSMLLPVIFACWKGRCLLQRENQLHFLAQAVMAVSICAALAWLYRHNPGSTAEWHLERNLAMQFSMLAWLRVTILLLGVSLALWGMRTAPVFVNRGFVTTLAVLLPATFFFGYIDELRDYYDVLPCGVVLVTAAVSDIWSRWKSIYRA